MPTNKLGLLTTKIGSGVTPRGGQSVYQDSGTHLIRSQNIYNHKFEKNGLVCISEETAEKMKSVEIMKEDILINITGDSVARVYIVPDEILPARVNQHVCILRTKSELNPHYLYYFLINPITQNHLLSIAGIGGTRNALTKEMLFNLIIEYPDYSTQEKIVKQLNVIKNKIITLQNQNDTLEQMAQAIFKSWFVDFDGVTEFEDSELGKIPKGWSVKRVKEIAEFNPENIGKDSIFSEIYYLDTSSVTEGKLTDIQRLAKNDAPSRAKRLVKKNDILISTVRPNLKHYYFIKNPRENLVVSTGFVVVRSKKISPFHLYYLITSDSFTEYLTGVADSHTSAYPSFPSEIIENTKICLPDIESDSISSSFNKILNPMFEKLEYNENQIRSLTKTRDALLPKLMSGEIRV